MHHFLNNIPTKMGRFITQKLSQSITTLHAYQCIRSCITFLPKMEYHTHKNQAYIT